MRALLEVSHLARCLLVKAVLSSLWLAQELVRAPSILAIAEWAGNGFRKDRRAGSNPAPQPNHVRTVVNRSAHVIAV